MSKRALTTAFGIALSVMIGTGIVEMAVQKDTAKKVDSVADTGVYSFMGALLAARRYER